MEIFYNEHGTIDRYEYYIFIGKYFIVYTEYKNKCNKYTIKKANLNGFEFYEQYDTINNPTDKFLRNIVSNLFEKGRFE